MMFILGFLTAGGVAAGLGVWFLLRIAKGFKL